MKTVKLIVLLAIFFMAGPGCKPAPKKAALVEHEKQYALDDTMYELRYEIPTIENIKDVLETLFTHIHSSTAYRVIDRTTGEDISDFSVPDSNAIVDITNGGYNLWDYTVGVIHTGMFAVGEILEDEKYTRYPINNYDFIFEHLPYFRERAKLFGAGNGTYHRIINMHALDHCGSIGAALVQATKYKDDPDYLSMIDTVENYIMHKQFRLEDGTLARQRPQKASVWADDFYMGIPFLARMGSFSGNPVYHEDAVRQVLQMSDKLFDWQKLIYDHGWNQNAGDYDPRIYWARANGWAMMATATLLDELPQEFPGRDSVLHIFRSHVKGVAELQGGNGLWHNLIDRFDSYSETSSTAMFIYCMAKGVNEGWLDHTYGAVAQAGWNGLVEYITPEGHIENMCAGTTFSPDLIYYYHRPPSQNSMHAYGASLLAGAEMIRLITNPEIQIVKQWRTFHYREN